jgi:uncharacterized protein (TIGR01244 family)
MAFGKKALLAVLFIIPVLLIFVFASQQHSLDRQAQEESGAALASFIPNYHPTAKNVATGGMPGNKGIKKLAENGYKMVIDLRTEAETKGTEKFAITSSGMNYLNIPVNEARGISRQSLNLFSMALSSAKGPVLVHCITGNRAGAIWAAYRLHQGAPWETALAEGKASGMSAVWERKLRPFCKTC